jgi:hypothetical protein
MTISIRDCDGVFALPLREAQRIDWSAAQPIRAPAFYPDQKRNPGWLYSVKAGRHLPVESRLEYAHLLIADLRSDVIGMLTQPLRLHWDIDGSSLSHVPDALLTLVDGSRELVNVTVDHRLDRADVACRLAAATEAALFLGWTPRTLVGAPPQILLLNARLLAGSRRPPSRAKELAPQVLAAVGKGSSIGEIEAGLAEPTTVVRPVLLHLLATGELACDLEQPLAIETVLRRGES